MGCARPSSDVAGSCFVGPPSAAVNTRGTRGLHSKRNGRCLASASPRTSTACYMPLHSRLVLYLSCTLALKLCPSIQ